MRHEYQASLVSCRRWYFLNLIQQHELLQAIQHPLEMLLFTKRSIQLILKELGRDARLAATHMLYELLNAARHRRVDYSADAPRIQTHPERNGRHHHPQLPAAESALYLLSLLRSVTMEADGHTIHTEDMIGADQ